jgi:hypothetical protein
VVTAACAAVRLLPYSCQAIGVGTCIGTVLAAQATEDKELKGQWMTIHKSSGLLMAGLIPLRWVVGC